MRERQFYWMLLISLIAFVAPTRSATMSGLVQNELGETILSMGLEFGNDAGIWFRRDVSDGRFEVNLIPGTWRVQRWSHNPDGTESEYFNQEYLIPVADSAVVTNLVFPKLRSRLEGSLRTTSGE